MSAVDCCNPQVDVYVMEPVPEGPGTPAGWYKRVVRLKTTAEIEKEIKAIVGKEPDGAEEYLTAMDPMPDDSRHLHRMVVYAVNGSSEGDYVHVEAVLTGSRAPRCILLGKTFMGRDAAWAFARRVADLLGA